MLQEELDLAELNLISSPSKNFPSLWGKKKSDLAELTMSKKAGWVVAAARRGIDVESQSLTRWKSLMINKFPRTTTEEELWAAFAAYGTLESVSIVKKDSKLGETYGFANFIEHKAAAHCLKALKNGAVILKDANGNPKVVKGKWAQKSKQFELRVGRNKAQGSTQASTIG
jgi:RNA recognition motif-containing protein